MAGELLHRKEKVILTAIEIIDELGYQGLSTKEIAKRQQISEGTLFRHFKNKTEIIIAVLEHFSKYDVDIFESVKIKKLSCAEAIMYIINAYATYYENYPAITAITQLYSVLSHEPGLTEKVRHITSSRFKFLSEVVKQGQAEGQIRPDIDGELVAEILSGASASICLRWRLAAYGFSLRERMMSVAQAVLDGFKIK